MVNCVINFLKEIIVIYSIFKVDIGTKSQE